MATADTEISQAAQLIGPFVWTEGDPVSLAWSVAADWSGDYTAQIRKTHTATGTLVGEFTITADFDGSLTNFVMTIAEVDSVPIKASSYFTDVQEVGGPTRVWGKVIVQPQVTVP